MPRNQSFKFKKFTINQDKCAMKVCTDACILGAYVNVENAERILDIGTGTGLLSLMVAQRVDTKIDAIEIDEDAYNQAIENVKNSPFSNQVSVYHSSIQEFTATSSQPFSFEQKGDRHYDWDEVKYPLIISNPPFYQNSLQSPDNQTNKALHNTELSFDELTDCVAKLLCKKGRFVVLLPYFETLEFVKIAQNKGLFLQHQLNIRHDENKPFFRTISTFGFEKQDVVEIAELKIWEENGKVYDQKFRELLKDYYLIF